MSRQSIVRLELQVICGWLHGGESYGVCTSDPAVPGTSAVDVDRQQVHIELITCLTPAAPPRYHVIFDRRMHSAVVIFY